MVEGGKRRYYGIILRPSAVDNVWFFGMASWEKEVHMQAHHTVLPMNKVTIKGVFVKYCHLIGDS